MPLLSVDIVVDRCRASRCLRCSAFSGDGSLFCSDCDPARPTGLLRDAEKALCLEVLRVVRDNAKRILADGDSATAVRRWMSRLVAKGEKAPEAALHAYIYLFWDSLVFEKAVVVPRVDSGGSLFFTSASLSDEDVSERGAGGRFVRRLCAKARADLVGLDQVQQQIFLVEIKRGSLDDRAVGQVLRYYDVCSRLLSTTECRSLSLNYVRPFLIVGGVERDAWCSLPQYFRDLVEIFRYRVDPVGGQLILENTRMGLLSN